MKRVYVDCKKPLVKNLLLIEGHGRAGKFFLGNILDGFDRVEHYQYASLMEHITHLEMLGLISLETARYLLQVLVDKCAYHMRVGRDLNFRFSDKSSLLRSHDLGRYVQRIFLERNNTEICKEFKTDGRYSVFIVHEGMPNMKIFFNTFKSVKTISILRHPVDLIFSWYSRQWCKREVRDPVSFMPCIKREGRRVPWYAYHWSHEYKKMSQMDRIIHVLRNLSVAAQKSYKLLKKNQKDRLLIINYENLVEKTNDVINLMGEFLNSKPLEYMPLILKRERCPVKISLKDRGKKMLEIRKKASNGMYKVMSQMAEEYEKKSQSGTWVQ